MPTLSTSACSFTFHSFNRSRKTEQYYDLNCFLPEHKNACSLFKLFCDKNSASYNDVKGEESIFKLSVIKDNINVNDELSYTYLIGQMSTGKYGIEAELVDKNTGDSVFDIGKNHAEIIPFDFVVMIKRSSEDSKETVQKGIIVFQNNGIHSIKSLFIKSFKQFVNAYVAECNDTEENSITKITMDMGNITSEAYLKTIWDKSRLTKIMLTKYAKKDDTSDFGAIREIREYYTPSLEEDTTQKIKRVFVNGGNVKLVEVTDFNYDVFRVELTEGKKKRSFRLNNIDNIVAIEDIPRDYVGADGHPVHPSAYTYYIEQCQEYLSNISCQVTS